MKVYVIGIGLIGGSMVLDIKGRYPDATILGIDSNEQHLQEAIDLGVIDEAGSFEDLQKAEIAFDNVLKSSPNYQDAYIFKARCNRLLENDENMAKNYEAYLEKITAKGAEEMAKPSNKSKLIESYNNIGAHYANSDIAKAKEFFNKTLLLDATNAYATDSLKSLK